MSVELESKKRIASLIDAANAATGNADTDLTAAVGSLIAGFGRGGDNDVLDALISGTLTNLEWQGTTVRYRAFMHYDNLQTVVLPNATKIYDYAFCNCYNISSVIIPKVEQIGMVAFSAVKKVTEIMLPSVKTFGTTVFEGCSELKKVDIGSGLSQIPGAVFRSCQALKTLILRSATVVSLSNISAFASTPFANGGAGGIVYVPSALVESYKTATNWSSLYEAGTCNFVAIEGSEYE